MNYLIIGNGVSGIHGAVSVRHYDKEGSILIITDETIPFYSRPLITEVMAGRKRACELVLFPEEAYLAQGIRLLKGLRVKKIRPAEGYLLTGEGKLNFDRLLVATGAEPKKGDLSGKGVFYLRTTEDAEQVRDSLGRAKSAIVYGGGPIGIKAAYALLSAGIPVSVIVSSGYILSRVLDRKASLRFQHLFENRGAEFYFNSEIDEVWGKKAFRGVVTNRGVRVAGDVLIIAKGVRPNVDLASEAGIATMDGILVDDHMETSVKGVYASGDAAEAPLAGSPSQGIVSLWQVGANQGKIAGQNMAGCDRRYEGSLSSNSLQYFGLKAISMGSLGGNGYEEVIYEDKVKYRKYIFQEMRLAGAIFVGDITDAGVFLRAIREGKRVIDRRAVLIPPGFHSRTNHGAEGRHMMEVLF
jgi:nitrite reductase (NADH) large subunit